MEDKEENIDKFIKKSIAYYDVQYDETHWEAMEKQLDAEMPVFLPAGTGLYLPTIIISILVGMVLMLGILWMNGVFENDGKVSESSNVEKLPFIKNDETADKEYAGTASGKNVTKDGNDQSTTGHLTDDPLKFVSSAEEDLRSEINMDGPTKRRAIYYMPMTGISSKGFNYSIPVNHDNAKVAGYPAKETSVSQAPTMSTETVRPAHQNKVQLGVSLGFAPDINGVNEPLGKSVSGLAGLQLFATYNQRFGIMTGVYYSKKKYDTEGENYFPPSGYWNRFTNGVVPTEVIGTSAVIDLPINLSYNWNPHKRLQFVTGVGVSSYFILNEDCWYKFDQSNPGSAYGWDTEEMTKQMWGVGNITVGVLWYLKPKINIRVEPYLKIPFSDFGWGRVNLFSTGTLISLQYTFN